MEQNRQKYGKDQFKVLGVHVGHDSSASLVIDGKIVADVAEERFTRCKHDAGLPIKSMNYCLEHAGITMDDLDAVAVPGGNALKLNSLFNLRDKRRFSGTWKQRLRAIYKRVIDKEYLELPVYLNAFDISHRTPIVKVPHHLSHAGSAFYTSGFTGEALIITLDGIGEGVSCGIWRGKPDGTIECLQKFGACGSLGWFYGNVTEALGWWHGDGEGKTMGLAPYGNERNLKKELEKFCPKYENGMLVEPHDFGMSSTWHQSGATQWHFEDATEIGKLSKQYPKEDLAAAAQGILEEQVQNIIYPWMEKTGLKQVCCAGGIFLNVKLNQRILYSGKCEKFFVFPNAGDSGVAAGAALCAYRRQVREYVPSSIEHIYWGPQWSNDEIESNLKLCRVKYEYTDDPSLEAAKRLADGKIIGWFQGRMESGPRALGNRSILVSANQAVNKDILNARVKFREGFRPFCPSILAERKKDYLTNGADARYMIVSFDVTDEKRDKVPAVVHADGTLRPQTVEKQTNPMYWALIHHFGELTGEYLVLNTSFNVMGEPIVLDPKQAIRCFYGGGMDSLVIGNFVVDKNL